MSRIELPTSSLPRKCSTTELQQLSTSICSHCNQFSTPHSNDFLLNFLSGRRGSNPRPTAWKAVALPTELLPHFFRPETFNICNQYLFLKHFVGREGFEPSKLSQRIYSPSHLATLESPRHLIFFEIHFQKSNEPLAGIEPATY